jgi:hypothetical protein
VENFEDFSRWSHCNGLPAQWKNTRIFQDGHIVMGYLPSGKIRGFFKNGHIVMDYLPREKNTRIFRFGHIVMGYLPSGEKYEDFSKVVTL